MVPLLFGVQRFGASAGLGVATSKMQSSVASSVGWASGELSILSPPDSGEPTQARARMLQLASIQGLPAEVVSLLNTLMSSLLALILTIFVQLMLVLAWRHLINRRFYTHQRAIAAAEQLPTDDPDSLKKRVAAEIGPEHCCLGVCGPRRKLKPPSFFPFPKSLVWPTPLFFTCCIFVTGLTRASVRVLAAWSSGQIDECGRISCLVLPVAVLSVLALLMILTIADLVRFRKVHGKLVEWKPGARPAHPSDVSDPYMRIRAKVRVLAHQAHAKSSKRPSVRQGVGWSRAQLEVRIAATSPLASAVERIRSSEGPARMGS